MHTQTPMDAMTQLPCLMVLGSHHMANPGKDSANIQADDVLLPRRQQEVEDLVARLATYRPTKIAVEFNAARDDVLNGAYSEYRQASWKLRGNEIEQVGFRLASQLDHDRIYGVDWNGEPPGNRDNRDFAGRAVSLGQQGIVDALEAQTRDEVRAEQAQLDQRNLIEFYRYLNDPARLHASNSIYFKISEIGLGEDYVGAEWVQHWYGRNLRIFVNVRRITEPADRILLLIGAGHAWPLRQIVDDAGCYDLVDPSTVLGENV